MLAPTLMRAPDQELLQRFARQGDETAFAVLVRRHGPMVLGVGQRILRQAQDAEDAFQATFLLLAHKAPSLRRQELVGNWLYGVTSHLARKLKTQALRRRAREGRVATR